MKKPLNIVLVHPEIPQNTGNIGRLCVSTDTRLHLIEPLGFSLEDKYIRRAGMDYWQHLELLRYPSWEAFLEQNPACELYFFTTKANSIFWDTEFPEGAYLVFGSEGHGLPEEFYTIYQERCVTIPMPGKFHRSYNLANSVSVALFEVLRQHRQQ